MLRSNGISTSTDDDDAMEVHYLLSVQDYGIFRYEVGLP